MYYRKKCLHCWIWSDRTRPCESTGRNKECPMNRLNPCVRHLKALLHKQELGKLVCTKREGSIFRLIF